MQLVREALTLGGDRHRAAALGALLTCLADERGFNAKRLDLRCLKQELSPVPG